ncbi:MerR family DNA-binding transcriptional regulator [Phenylobacterium sp.]|uniref:MerR family transcriptional regulator n=1 Tax=Phenylobacterium sp. TaxID=1871053 RepID=UPI002C9C3826|nr:MerR family DNA-binding transcriptional regulator [Phenylobacterium sp.]HVI30956.1 MerR family DNA-binding transcriptional regulator [Phenylobacterium sp.]
MEKLRRLAPFRTYSITQLCREFGCTARALRFYEEQGLLFPRRQQMQRVYSYKDRARLQLIVRGRKVGLTIAEIRDILDTYEDGGEEAQNALALKVFKARIAALQSERSRLEDAMQTLSAACERLAGGPTMGKAAA